MPEETRQTIIRIRHRIQQPNTVQDRFPQANYQVGQNLNPQNWGNTPQPAVPPDPVFNEWATYNIPQAVPRTTPAIQQAEKAVKIQEAEDEMPGKRANTFRIGADPEFVLLDGVKIVNAGLGATGEVGGDHGGYVVELRPGPAFSAYTITKRIQKLLNNEKLSKFKNFKWRAGAYLQGYPRAVSLGGHIHVDKNPKAEEKELLVRALDRLTSYLEALDILPKEESTKRRDNCEYGKFGDCRTSNDGGHLEYRTMASWLTSPKQAFLALTSAKLASVNPQITLDCLRPRTHSFENLKGFFDYYKHKDVDADRAIEKVLDDTIKKCQTDPDQDIKGAWETLAI